MANRAVAAMDPEPLRLALGAGWAHSKIEAVPVEVSARLGDSRNFGVSQLLSRVAAGFSPLGHEISSAVLWTRRPRNGHRDGHGEMPAVTAYQGSRLREVVIEDRAIGKLVAQKDSMPDTKVVHPSI